MRTNFVQTCKTSANRINLNRITMRVALIGLFISLGIGNAWARDSYYAKVTASATPTGAGSVYVKANAMTGATTGNEASATSPDKQNTNYNFALLAVTGYGYEFSQWALGANPSGGNQSLTNAGSRTTAYVTARTKNSDGTLNYTVQANFNRRAIEAAGVTETSLSSPQTWRAHGSAAKVEFEDKYVLNQSDITITYPTDFSTVAKSVSWNKGTTDNNSDGAAVTNGRMTVTMTYDFSNPTALVHNPSATMTVKEQMESVSQTSSAVAIGLDLTPNFSTDKSSHTFPATEINTTANATISATSYGDLPVSNSKCVWSYTLTGTNADQFSCSLTNGVATITYKPTAAGTHNASLTMTAQWTDAAGTVLAYSAPAVPINGTATAPDFSIGNLSYETTTDVGAKTKSLTLTNISYVTSATIAFSGENASCFSATAYNTDTKSFDITFTPPVSGGKNQAGTYTATATVTGSAAASDAVRTCTLTAVVNPAPVASFTVPSAIVFNNGEDMADGATDDQTLTLTNIQNVVGTPTITITGTDASMYAVQGGYDSENNAFTIRFTAGGTKGGRLTADATVTVANYDGETVSKTVTLNAFMEEVVAFEARVTKANGDVIKEGTWAECLTAANNNAGSTLTLMKNIDLGTITATNNISKAMTIDLNGKELRAAVNATSIGVLTITAAVPVTIKDSRTGGKIINEIARNSEIRTIFVNKAGATLTLESGTISCHNTAQYSYGTAAIGGTATNATAMETHTIQMAAGSVVNIRGGRVEAYGTRTVQAIRQLNDKNNTTTLNITGGEVYAEGPAYVYGIHSVGNVNISGGTVTTYVNDHTTNGNAFYIDSLYRTNKLDNTYILHRYNYGIYLTASSNATAANCYAATLNVTGGTINVTNINRTLSANGTTLYTEHTYGIYAEISATGAGAGKTAPDGTKVQKACAVVDTFENATLNVTHAGVQAYGILVRGCYNSKTNTTTPLKIKNSTINVTSYQTAYGVLADAYVNWSSTLTNLTGNGGCTYGNVEMTNVTINATTTGGTGAYCAWASATSGTVAKAKAETGSTSTGNATYYGEYAVAGKITVNSGTYSAYAKTSSAYGIGSSDRAKCVRNVNGVFSGRDAAANPQGSLSDYALTSDAEAYPELYIHGGTFKAKTLSAGTARAVKSGGTTIIDGGTFEADAATSSSVAIAVHSGKTTVSGVTMTAYANTDANAVYVPATVSEYSLFDYAGEVELNNCVATVVTRTAENARGVYVNSTTRTYTLAQFNTAKEANNSTYKTYGDYWQVGTKAISGKATINGGSYTVKSATKNAYGVLLTTNALSTDGTAKADGEIIARNATFNVQTLNGATAYGIQAGGKATVDGCNLTVTASTSDARGVYSLDEKTIVKNSTITTTTSTSGSYGTIGSAVVASNGVERVADFELSGNTISSTAGTETAYAIYMTGASGGPYATDYFTGSMALAATAVVNSGTYSANASTKTAYAAGVADPLLKNEATATPTLIINGGKFKGTAGAAPFADVSLAGEPGYFVLNGGYYVKDENLDKKLGEGMNKVAVKSGTPEYTEGYRWRVTDNMTGEYVCKIKEKSTSYASLEEALQVVNATPNSTWTIIMIANYTLSKGDYVLPAKTTLLIPYQSGQTAINGATPKYTSPSENVEQYEAPTPLYKLTFANGVNMSVYGKIEASAVTYLSNQGLTTHGTGVVSGKYGWLYLNEGSHIDLESGSALYAWGYVTGKGEINAKNGSAVYEDFQMGDWRGGSEEINVQGNENGLDKKGVFLITHYYYQNIECPITYRAGAQGMAHGGTYMYKKYLADDKVPTQEAVKMIGTSGAMFLMDPATAGEDTWVRKEYDTETDYVNWTMNSGAKLGSVSLKMELPWVGDIDVSSSDYVLPITSNFNIVANDGEIQITNHVCFLPGSKLTIKKEGTLTIPSGQRVFFYDQDNWLSYGGYWFNPYYSPSWKVNPRVATIGDKTKVKMPDAEVLVEGLLNVNGAIYTTAGGANIHSTRENAGKVKFGAALPAATAATGETTGSTTLYQWKAGGPKYDGKALNPAWLKNEDGTYSKPTSANTSAGDTWTYMQSLTEDTYEWTLASEDGCFTTRKTGDTKTYVHPSDWVAVGAVNANHAYPSEDATRMFVNTEAASTSASCKWWDVNPTPEVIEGTTYYVANNENFDNFGTYYYWDNTTSYWKPKKITVTWQNEDGTKITNGTYGDLYSFNTSPQFHGTNPKKTSTAIEKYDWIGWRDEDGNIYDKNATLPRATSDVIYTAYFNTTKYQYTITFKNDDNSDLWAGLVDAGTTGEELQALFETKYNEKTGNTVPQKAPTVDKVFTFTGWNTTLVTVNAAATYTAQYSNSTRQYHVTFYNYDAVTVLYETDVDYNTNPVYSGVTPFRANTSAFSYDWTGWQQGATTYGTTATLPVVTGNISYIATFAQTELQYQVFFKRQDGSIIDAPKFSYGETPAAFPADSTMASTVSTDYTFREWSPATLVPVTEDGKVYTALFDESPRQYTAHFVNYNGTSLKADQTIDYNTVPAYTGVTPMKPNDSRNSYEFSGWAWAAGDGWEAGSIDAGEAFPAIKGEITFKAQFTETLLQFNVIYKREDGTIIEQQKKKWGETTAFPYPVASYEDETYTYTFDHWSPATVESPVTADATYTAYYNQSIKTYSITAVGISPAGYGSVSPASLSGIPGGSTVTVNGNKITVNGTTITATPTAATAQYTYDFDHWNNVPATVTGNISDIEAVFTRTTNTYTITWNNWTGANLETDLGVEYGATPTYNGATPMKAEDENYTYTFNGSWSPAITSVTGDATYTAQFNAVSKETGFWLDIIDVDNANASSGTLTINTNGWASSGWPYTVNEVVYEKGNREADRTLIIPYTGEVGATFAITVTNKNSVIVSKHNYIIPAEITANANLADQQILYVKSGATLTVNVDKTVKNIYVAPGAKMVVNNDITLTADTVFLRTTPWASAELELDGTISGQVCYTRIIKKKDQYYQFGLPMDCPIANVRLSDGSTPTYGNGWLLRSYSESKRATQGSGSNIDNWTTLTNEGADANKTIQGCVGYEMFSNSGYYREYYFPVAHTGLSDRVAVTRTTEATVGAAQEGWNIIVSPLMRTYTQSPAPEGATLSWLQEDGSYWQLPVTEIKPAIPFSYQATQTGYIVFNSNISLPAPQRRVAAAEEYKQIQWLQLDLIGANGKLDETSIYAHPTRYEQTYQTGIDVAKQSFTASRALIYSSHAYGEMAFAGVSDELLEQGVALTVYSPKAQELTISMRKNDWLNRMAYVWLIDQSTGAQIDLLDSDYSFNAEAGTTAGRFILMGAFFAPQITTDNGNVQSDDEHIKAKKFIYNDKMYIQINGVIYDATGKLVK